MKATLRCALAFLVVAAATYGAAAVVGVRAGLHRVRHAPVAGAFLLVQTDAREEASELPIEIAERLYAGLPAELRAFAVVERVARAELATPGRSDVVDVLVRGTEASALSLHGVVLTSGRFPAPNERAVVIPASRAVFADGGRLRFAATWWPVVGTISAPDSIYGSEIWCDRHALVAAMRTEARGAMFFRPPRSEDADVLRGALARDEEAKNDFVVVPLGDYLGPLVAFALDFQPWWMIALSLFFLLAAATAATTAAAVSAARPGWGIALGGGGLGAALAWLVRVTHVEHTLAISFPTPRTAMVALVIATFVLLVAASSALAIRRA